MMMEIEKKIGGKKRGNCTVGLRNGRIMVRIPYDKDHTKLWKMECVYGK